MFKVFVCHVVTHNAGPLSSESLGPKYLLVSLEFIVMGGKGVVVCEMVTEIS